MLIDLDKFEDQDLIGLYPKLIKELKKRKIIRTNNIVGKIGEFYALEIYKKTSGLPKIHHAPPSTKNIDAISVNGERYAIKSSSTNQTGNFSSLPIDDDKRMFEFLITIWFDKEYEIYLVLECNWDIFVKHRKIKNPEKRWEISKAKSFIADCKKIFDRET